MDKMLDFLKMRRRNLQLALDQHKFGPFKDCPDYAIRGKIAEVQRLIRKYDDIEKALEKETWSYRKNIDDKRKAVMKQEQSSPNLKIPSKEEDND